MDIGTSLAILPVAIPLAGAMIGLLLVAWQRAQAWWTLGTMATSLASSAWLLAVVWRTGPVVFASGGWPLTPVPVGIVIVGDLLSAVFVVMAQLVMVTGIMYAMGSKDAAVRYPAFYPLFLLLATGLTGAMLTGDMFNLYVFAELLVISGTVLTAVSDDRYGTEAAYKYFYISLLAAFFMLLAVGSLYASYGTLNMATLSDLILETKRPLLYPAIALLMAFFMVKSAVFPFHFWQPDFHTAAPTPVSAMLSSIVVKLGVYGFLRMTTLLFIDEAPTLRALLVAFGVIGVVFGGLSAIGTHNVKRMLAYSTLAQIGFILVGIGWGTPLALAAAIVFAFNHSLIKSAMLMLAGYVASRASVKSAAFDVVTGVGRKLPLAGVLFFVGALALAGIPPTNGFVSKMLLFDSGIDAAQFAALLLIGLASVFTLIYVMRAFQRIWWLPPAEGIYTKPQGDRLVAPVVLIVLIVLFGVFAGPLVTLAGATGTYLLETGAYVAAVLGG